MCIRKIERKIINEDDLDFFDFTFIQRFFFLYSECDKVFKLDKGDFSKIAFYTVKKSIDDADALPR